MKQAIALLFLVNTILINAKSLTPDGQITNPCTPAGLYTMQYYYPYPRDDSRYIECDPWGQMYVKECPEGSKWNTWISSCVIQMPENDVPKQIVNNETQTCTFHGNWTCKNGGFCNQFISDSKCFCLSNFTGEFCELVSPSIGAFGQLINDSFSLEIYKNQRPLSTNKLAFNTSIDMSMILNEVTKKRVQDYLNKYPKGEMRFDTLINYLVQDFLSQVYPSAYYLREFLINSEIAMGYTNAIPNLLQTAKYSYDNFENFFKIFVEMLDRLVEYLPKHMVSVKEDAQSFYEVYDMIYSRVVVVENISKVLNITNEMLNKTDLTRDEMKKSIHDDFNATLSYSYNLFRYLNRFDDDLSVNGVNYTSEKMQEAILNFTMNSYTNELLQEINLKSTSIWDSMSFYGFWYVISSYIVPNAKNAPLKHEQPAITPSQAFLISDKVFLNKALADEVSRDSTKPMPIKQSSDDSTKSPRQSNLKIRSHSDVDHKLEMKSTLPPKSSNVLVKQKTVHSTTVMPKINSLVSESTILTPSAGALGTQESTVLRKLDGWSMLPTTNTANLPKVTSATILLPMPSSILSDSTSTIVPKFGALVGDSTSTIVPKFGALVGDSTSTVVPKFGALVGDSTRILQKSSESTPVPTVVSNKLAEGDYFLFDFN